MENRKTLGSYVESGNRVTGVRFSGNFGSDDGDLRDYTFVDGGVLRDTSVVEVRLINGVYHDQKQFPIRVSNHLTDYSLADA